MLLVGCALLIVVGFYLFDLFVVSLWVCLGVLFLLFVCCVLLWFALLSTGVCLLVGFVDVYLLRFLLF